MNLIKENLRLYSMRLFIVLFLIVCSRIQANDSIPKKDTFEKISNTIIHTTYKLTHKKDSSLIAPIAIVDSIISPLLIPKNWTLKNKAGIILTQTSFVNWTKGGNNSIAGIAHFNSDVNYKSEKSFWNNHFRIRYGLSKEEESDFEEKTEDIIDVKSSFGYRYNNISRWYIGGEFSLRTQLTKGYKGNNRTNYISTFFAPARMRLGMGADYSDKKNNLKIHISPITNQTTYVLDRQLANSGAYGVKPAVRDANGVIIKKGETKSVEFGSLIKGEWTTDVMKNITFNSRASLYSDYLEDYGNIDMDMELNVEMKVNKYVQANISSHIVYDDDAFVLEDDGSKTGPRIQLKQILGVGVNYLF